MKFTCGTNMARLIGMAIFRICRLLIPTCKLFKGASAIIKSWQSYEKRIADYADFKYGFHGFQVWISRNSISQILWITILFNDSREICRFH